ncbi:probable elongator complex protein 2 [Thrips palmi]|uniref:Elongator complex protein 2 n=1 Tax=Thrips palmi TaxID=161013 RepID=A0A6P8ZNB7_THRPL|nr:probable elongator complex protein 2 [Thrips palmi]
MAAPYATRYISTACNRTPGSLSWGGNNLICFGACNSVAIYDPEAAKITETLSHHKGRVNSVKWVQPGNYKSKDLSRIEIVSASSDKSGVVWSKDDTGNFMPSALLIGHSDVVTQIDSIYLDDKINCPALLVVTASADSTVKLWLRNTGSNELTCIHTLRSGSGLFTSVKLCILPRNNVPLLAVASDDAKIHLYTVNVEIPSVHLVHNLTGHEDWLRSLDFAIHDAGDVLLASAGQDMLIRIWRLSPRDSGNCGHHSSFDPKKEIKLEEEIFSIETRGVTYHWAAILDSVLAGHEGWVYSVCWHPRVCDSSGKENQPFCLLSASLDKTMVVWALGSDEADSVWLEKARVGEVGGNTLGFYGCQFAPDGKSILAHGYQGSFHLWHHSEDSDIWLPGLTVGGHFDEVTDLDWEPDGVFLISVSADQTSRLHAPWVQSGGKVSWHELARPQVHGYDIQCLAILSRYQYASGAEEKVVRLFKAPGNFIENFQRICCIKEDNVDQLLAAAPAGASVPSLGLSNKAVFDGDTVLSSGDSNQAEFPEGYFTPVSLAEPPKEEDLLQNTLWPEIQKLYGHGYELFSLAASHDGKLLVSACKASSSQHAAIILWDALNWQQLQKLHSHELTVTQLSFSPNDKFILSVSRDRCWSIFERQADGTTASYQLLASTNKSTCIHTRIIWSSAWTPDSKYFSTGSREGKIVVWGGNDVLEDKSNLGYWSSAGTPLILKDSVTSLAFAPQLNPGKGYLLAAGLEAGNILLYTWKRDQSDPWTPILSLNQNQAHHLTVKQLSFRPHIGEVGEQEKSSTLLLASAGADHTVKIHALSFNYI